MQTFRRLGVPATRRVDALDVRVPTTVGLLLGPRHVVTEARALAAHVTYGSHWSSLPLHLTTNSMVTRRGQPDKRTRTGGPRPIERPRRRRDPGRTRCWIGWQPCRPVGQQVPSLWEAYDAWLRRANADHRRLGRRARTPSTSSPSPTPTPARTSSSPCAGSPQAVPRLRPGQPGRDRPGGDPVGPRQLGGHPGRDVHQRLPGAGAGPAT